jgi:2-haloacid dehalogenase
VAITTCIFDAYGTLFDVNSAARRVAEESGRDGFAKVWQKVANDWRLKQLQYTWLRSISGEHTDFWAVTQDGLDWAMEASGLEEPDLRERLLALYWKLSAYPEVPAILARLKAAGMTCGILSNGSPAMLEGAVESAGLRGYLDGLLSVESVGIFKPHKKVYDLVGAEFSCIPDQVLFVSSNGWDAAASAGYGFHTAWVNRAGDPVDRLAHRPSHILRDLEGIPDLASSL